MNMSISDKISRTLPARFALFGLIFILCACAADQPGSSTLSPTNPVDMAQTVDGSLTPTAMAATSTIAPEAQNVEGVLSVPPPQLGWSWYENERFGFAVPYPDTWRQDGATFHAPESNSQVQVRVHDIPTGVDWLDWLRRNQESLIMTAPVAPELVTANATVQGRPAYFRLAESSGSSQILIAFPDGEQLIRFYFHSGVLPRSEAEMQIFRTMIENIIIRDGVTGKTTLPAGWEQGGNLVIFLDLVRPQESTPDRQDMSGIVEEWDLFQATMTSDDGQSLTLQLGLGYHFLGLPRDMAPGVPGADALQTGDRILVRGYTLDAAGAFRPEYIAVEQNGSWQPVAYKAFFDLTHDTMDAALLAGYPQAEDVFIWLRGPLAQVLPYLVDEAGHVLTAETLALDAAQDVLAGGRLQSTEPPRLVLSELYARRGGCELVSATEEVCYYWQRLWLE